ncbi:MAG: NAD-glutamate dehydrogenase, partial [Xanthomonadales bacterium]|nr:NAD-glutamate dehydrogenase [Xanthomonadales bacterium]
KKQVESLKVTGQWHAISRSNLRDELFSTHNHLVDRVLLGAGKKKNPVDAWMESHENAVKPVVDMLNDMKKTAGMDYPTISVAVGALGQLVARTGNEA